MDYCTCNLSAYYCICQPIIPSTPASMSSLSANGSPDHSSDNSCSQSKSLSFPFDKSGLNSSEFYSPSNNMASKNRFHFGSEGNTKIEENSIISQLNILASHHQFNSTEETYTSALNPFQLNETNNEIHGYITDNNNDFISHYIRIDEDEDISDG